VKTRGVWKRQWLFFVGLTVFGLCVILNASFFLQYQASPFRPHHDVPHHQKTAVPSTIPQLLFTSTCSKRDLLRAQVLAFTAREQLYHGKLTHIIYNCNLVDFHELATNTANPYNVSYFHAHQVFNTIKEEKEMDTKEYNPYAILAWYEQFGKSLAPSDFVGIFEVDTIFTRSLDLQILLHTADAALNPTAIGQV
jgi:hypothetical protein